MAEPLKKHTDRHHRKPRSIGGRDEVRNVIRVRRNKHQAFHLLFSNLEPPEIARILTETWVDPDWIIVAVKRIGGGLS